MYRDEINSLQILLSRTHAGPGRTVKQEQEEISPNHVQRINLPSVLFWRPANANGRILRSFYGSAFCPSMRPSHRRMNGGGGTDKGGGRAEGVGQRERGED